MIVAHDERQVDVWRREGAEWVLHTTRGSGVAAIESLGCALPLDEVYRNPLAA